MIYKCRCGRRKTGQPFNSASEKKWVCSSACAEADRKELSKRKPKPRMIFANQGGSR